MNVNLYHADHNGHKTVKASSAPRDNSGFDHEFTGSKLNSGNQYVIMIAILTPRFNLNHDFNYKIQKGDILFSTRDYAMKWFSHLDKSSQNTLIIKKLTRHNSKLIQQLHEFDDFIMVSPAVKASHPILNDTLDIIENYYIKEPKILSSILDRLFMIIQSEALNALRLSQRAETKLSEVIQEQKIAKALSLIHTNLNEDWPIARLSSEVQMTEQNFLEQFKKVLAIDPATYILKWRLQHAISLLDQNKLKLPQVAQMSGFKSAAKFCQRFTDNFGFSPEQYRSKNTH